MDQAHTGATAAGYGHLKALTGHKKKKTVQPHDLRANVLLKNIYILILLPLIKKLFRLCLKRNSSPIALNYFIFLHKGLFCHQAE